MILLLLFLKKPYSSFQKDVVGNNSPCIAKNRQSPLCFFRGLYGGDFIGEQQKGLPEMVVELLYGDILIKQDFIDFNIGIFMGGRHQLFQFRRQQQRVELLV